MALMPNFSFLGLVGIGDSDPLLRTLVSAVLGRWLKGTPRYFGLLKLDNLHPNLRIE
jgi:hypothetical protein